MLAEVGRDLRRWREVEAFVESVLSDPAYLDLFPEAPLDVMLDRRSRSATASVALPGRDIILIRDGSWNALTVLHELSHLIEHAGEAHGPEFVHTELQLIRRFCGFHAYALLRQSFIEHDVSIAGDAAHQRDTR